MSQTTQVAIKGLHKILLPFEQFATLMCQQALSEQRRLLQAQQEGGHHGAVDTVGRHASHERHR